jgi:ribosome-binding factor A
MMQPTPVKRSVRVAERVREEIARALVRDLSDPRLVHAVVTRVEMPDDLSIARVWVRLAAGGSDEPSRVRLLAGLSAARGLLRKQVGKSVGLRRAPELRFQYDEGQDASARIEEILHEIKTEKEEDEGD